MQRLEHTPHMGSSESSGHTLSAPEVQGALMLIAYRKAHEHDEQPPKINLNDLEANDIDLQVAAMNAWIADGEDGSFAKRFRDYVDAHPHAHINERNEEALKELLEDLSPESQTLH
jgi:hypothetical protein